jgi:hypothetical protein
MTMNGDSVADPETETPLFRGLDPRDIVGDIAGDVSESGQLPPHELLLKAIRTLPQDEQDVVLGYVLQRTLVAGSAAGQPSQAHSFTARTLPAWPTWAARLIVHAIIDGATVDQLAAELQLEADVVRSTLRDAARRQPESGSRARLLELVADGSTIAEASEELGLALPQARDELEPTHALTGAISAALTARTALPRPPIRLEAAPQGPLRTVPVRFPKQQYERLKAWSEEHNFPMAVVVRGLVERFLDEQQRRTT